MAKSNAAAGQPLATAVTVGPPDGSMNKRTASTKNYIITLVIISVVVVGVGTVVAKTMITSAVVNQHVLKAKTGEAKDQQTKIDALGALKDNYQKFKDAGNESLVLEALPTDSGYQTLLSQIEVVAAVSGVSLKSLTPVQNAASTVTGAVPMVSGGDTPIPLVFSITISGSYTQTIAFLSNLESYNRVFNFSDMKLDGNSSALDASITLTAYTQAAADIAPVKEQVK